MKDSQRRRFLKSAGVGMAILAGVTGVVSAGGGDPRPDPKGGSQPNKNVPTTPTGALDEDPWNQTSEIPAGHWILHNNGWAVDADKDSKQNLKRFANTTFQRYIINGEVFILDEFDDWEYIPDADGKFERDLLFEYTTPPKSKGETYTIRWEFEALTDEFAFLESRFPYENEVEIVGRN